MCQCTGGCRLVGPQGPVSGDWTDGNWATLMIKFYSKLLLQAIKRLFGKFDVRNLWTRTKRNLADAINRCTECLIKSPTAKSSYIYGSTTYSLNTYHKDKTDLRIRRFIYIYIRCTIVTVTRYNNTAFTYRIQCWSSHVYPCLNPFLHFWRSSTLITPPGRSHCPKKKGTVEGDRVYTPLASMAVSQQSKLSFNYTRAWASASEVVSLISLYRNAC